MVKNSVKHINHYLPLVGIMVAASIGFIVFSYDDVFRFIIVVSMAAAYVTWGVVHHKIHNDLTFAVFAEYTFIAILGVVVVTSLLIRG